ncbi:MAG: hypothetical protein ACFE0R_13895 [Salinarimonas sp.]
MYTRPDGTTATAAEAVDECGVLRDGFTIGRKMMLTDSVRPPAADRITFADLAELGTLPKAIPPAIATELEPIARDLATLANRKAAEDVRHRLELAHARISTKLEAERDAMRMGVYTLAGNAAEIEAGWAGQEAALSWITTTWAAIEGAMTALRDAAPAGNGWDRALAGAGLSQGHDAAPAASGWDSALSSAGLAKRN